MHLKKVAAWFSFTANFMIALHFFEDMKVNGIQMYPVIRRKWYHDMHRDFVLPNFQQRGYLQDITSMKSSVPPHIDHLVKHLLRQYFTDERLIRRRFLIA
ncbi:hypothetical protein TNCV_817961 [Trichonephila clavipes]|nr:hypothetical protein TNCV_817961 [Trichonephila clavipes]